MNSLEAMYGCGLNFFIKLAYNSLFLYKFASLQLLKMCRDGKKSPQIEEDKYGQVPDKLHTE